jgi:hypothetical protein
MTTVLRFVNLSYIYRFIPYDFVLTEGTFTGRKRQFEVPGNEGVRLAKDGIWQFIAYIVDDLWIQLLY